MGKELFKGFRVIDQIVLLLHSIYAMVTHLQQFAEELTGTTSSHWVGRSLERWALSKGAVTRVFFLKISGVRLFDPTKIIRVAIQGLSDSCHTSNCTRRNSLLLKSFCYEL